MNILIHEAVDRMCGEWGVMAMSSKDLILPLLIHGGWGVSRSLTAINQEET
jgi:hypothetical protein